MFCISLTCLFQIPSVDNAVSSAPIPSSVPASDISYFKGAQLCDGLWFLMQLQSDPSIYLKVRTKTLEVNGELIDRLMFLLCSQCLKPVKKGQGTSILFSPFASDALVCRSLIQKWQRNDTLLWGPCGAESCKEFVTRWRPGRLFSDYWDKSQTYWVKGRSSHHSPSLKYFTILKVSSCYNITRSQ